MSYAFAIPVCILAACSGLEPTSSLRSGIGPSFLESSAADPANGVRISQVYGGGGNSGAPLKNDFVELFNSGSGAVSLDGWSIQYASATGTGNFGANSGQLVALTGSIEPGRYYLVQLAGGTAGEPLPAPNRTGTINMSGSAGKVALANTTLSLGCNGGSTPCTPAALAQILDLVGYGNANFYEGSAAAPTASNTTAVFRKLDGCSDTNDNAADFATGAPSPRNSAAAAKTCPLAVASTTPTAGAADVALTASITVSFNKPVAVADDWFDITCSASGAHTATATGGPTVFTLDPDGEFASSETCTGVIRAGKVADLGDESNTLASDYTWSFTTVGGSACGQPYTGAFVIQGNGAASPLAGKVVTTEGVVVGDYEGALPTLRGFYLQDRVGDGDAATSDAVFVFNGSNDNVSLGDMVRVTGRAAEFQGQTQVSASTVTVCANGTTVNPADVTLPFASAADAERFEGMLVRLPQTLYVTEHFQLGRFGQVVVSSGGRLMQPTSVVSPGAAASALQATNDLNRLIVDDAQNDPNPGVIVFGRGGEPLSASNTLRAGDAATGIVGVMTYTWSGNNASGNAYRVRPIGALGGGAPTFVPANPRPAAPVVGGGLKVAALNVLNYFNSFSGCTNGVGGASTDCRGADNAAEFERQWPKTVAAIVKMNADVIGLMEIENDGYGAQSAIADLVAKLNAATSPGTYAFIDADGATGQTNALGTDAIKVGLIYKPASVTPTGITAVLNSEAFVNGGDAEPRNRPALAQAFIQPNRSRLIVTVNHLKSKGSACAAPDAGDGQGNCSAVRTHAARELARWLASDPTDTGDPDVLIVGDLNSYAQEDPITALADAGYANLIASRLGPNAYSYAFNGQWGYLDHALASASLSSQVAGVTEWHINADEPSVLDYNMNFKSAEQLTALYAADEFRGADHDPVIVGLDLRPPPVRYSFSGFFFPLSNPPAYNSVGAGMPVPAAFKLGGNRGLGIFAPGYPASRPISCTTGARLGPATPATAATRSGLIYHRGMDVYVYPWKTEPSWENTCRELVVRLADETQHTVRFRFGAAVKSPIVDTQLP